MGLLGPNGAGKTTCFYIIAGLIKPDIGNINIGKINITGYPVYERARIGLGYLPQEMSIFKGLSVEDNLLSIIETKNLTIIKDIKFLRTYWLSSISQK